jgi:uncharacterized surface protein with fasciclin (FAS1) repeats
MKRTINLAALAVIAAISIFYVIGCKKKVGDIYTTSDVNIYEYLVEHPKSYSSMKAIVDKSGYAGFLNAYGSYTMFVPTDSAVSIYLGQIGKSLGQLTETDAQNIVKFHLLEDTLATSTFKDGKLPTITMYGQYLVTAVVNNAGVSSFNINKQALITTGNIRTGNGLIHEIDHVLIPASKSIAELITADARFSIFKQALVATGYYDTLNTINSTVPSLRRWFTVLAETDQAIRDSGYANYNALKAHYSNTGNPLNPLDSLNIYIKYHIIPESKYMADIVSASSHYTLAPLEVLASKLDGEKILLNDLDFNGVHEKGVELERPTSDISATTGVLHTALAHFAPKIRKPTAVFWDMADFPEVRKLPAVFRRANFTFAYGSTADITWEKNDAANDLSYNYTTATNFAVWWGDYLNLRMGATGARNFWYQFKTPLLIKGRYKVWVCYRAAKQSGTIGLPGGSNMPVQVSFDGQSLSRPFNFTEQRPNLTDGEMEALGWKRYTGNTTLQVMTGKYLGIVDILTTDRHTIRMDALSASSTGQQTNYLDMMHFIPINDNQYLPRFNPDGTLQYF